MKTTNTAPPVHPHHATPIVLIDSAGQYHVRIDVALEVPSRVAAHLTERADGSHLIQCAQFRDARDVKVRASNWKRGYKLAGSAEPAVPNSERMRQAIAEGCDTRIFIRITAEEWHLVGTLCGRLNITPGQWLLGCAAYSADVAERALDRQLAEIPEHSEAEQPR